MSSEMSAPPPRPGPPGPPVRRRLARSNHDRLWAGVAGGVAEYFELDPSLVRLLFVLAAIVTWGAAIALYIAAWIILPRDDRPSVNGPPSWHDWSEEFHSETHRLAEEARRVADDVRHRPPSPPPAPGSTAAPTSAGFTATPPPAGSSPAPSTTSAPSDPDPWWQSDRYVDRHHHGNHPRSAGIVLVAIGVLFPAANAGLFNLIDWRVVWPLSLIGLGLYLFARQRGWR